MPAWAVTDPVVEIARRLLGSPEEQKERLLARIKKAYWAMDDIGISRPNSDQAIPCAEELMRDNPELHPAVIHGLLREGEILNLIAPPKTGKSWLVLDLALAVCTGRQWLGVFPVEKGRVLIVDNELHAATSANRLPRVADARQIPVEEWGKKLSVANLRGHLQDLLSMGPFFEAFEPGQFKVIILDAFYRFLPIRTDENDNGSITALYNHLDHHAKRLRCAFVLIHHSSKGSQAGKEITDVGAGAGAQARATDTHLILRRHREEDAVTLEAVTRSWAPMEPKVLRWQFPVWNIDEALDPADLKDGTRRKENEGPDYDVPAYVDRYLGSQPKTLAMVMDAAARDGFTGRRAQALLDEAVASEAAFRWDLGQRKVGYANQPQHGLEAPPAPQVEPEEPTTAQRVSEAVTANPGASAAEIAETIGVSKRRVNQILAIPGADGK